MENTRDKWKSPLFGDPCELKDNMLPTYADVMKYYEWVRRKIKLERNTKKEPSYKEIEAIVVTKVANIWKKASIPTIQIKGINVMLKAYHLKCKNILKSHPKIPQIKLEEFRRSSRVLFDISSCKCTDISKCTCPKEKKVPTVEQRFLIDQRSTRKMFIGGIDTVTTRKLTNTLKRKFSKAKYQLRAQKDSTKQLKGCVLSGTESSTCTTDEDDNFTPQNQVQTAVTPTKTLSTESIDYDLLSKTCDRFGVSDRAAAAITSAVLHSSTAEVIDKNRMRRKRDQLRKSAVLRAKISEVPALYFDGRKDKTLIVTKKDGKTYKETILEEHISLIKEPETKFLGYIAPDTGTSKCIEKCINDFFLEENLPMDSLLAVGCDGTNVNTGKYAGIIRLLEKRLNKPLQWIVCLLHMNELPFPHLFHHLDGKTSGPQTLTGPIGKSLDNCEKRPIVQYQPIPTELPEVSAEDLSSDQKYLYRIVLAVTTGEFPTDLANKSPGKMSHARWLTRANRVMRLYVSTESPSQNLVVLATFIVRAYAPTWFAIKTHPTCKDGARHFYQLVSATRYLPAKLKAIVDPVIQRNSYFAHPENLLLAMLTDPQQHIRKLAARRILKARRNKSNGLRLFQVPSLNFNASSYTDLIEWNENITEPPILKLIPDEDFQIFIEQKGDGDLPLLRLPCHSQAVERAVKTVTEASAKLSNKSARDGFIKAQIESRKAMPKFESKKDFRAN